MKRTEEFSSFFYSQYFADGLRITLGSIVPIIVCALVGEFITGTLISLGALIVGLSDTPGAPTHRRMGMIYCTILCILTVIVTAFLNNFLIAMTLAIGILSFIFSMFAVFNARAATVGTMCILVMLINVDDVYTFNEEFTYLLYFIIGASWYMTISMSLTQARPYRLAQQELSETILHVADYIRLKANFYDIKQSLDNNYLKLIEKQVIVNIHQENVRDILFQSKRSIKDTTKEGRYLTLIFTDIVDLFEQSMTTHYDYETIRNNYGETAILEQIKNLLYNVTHELDNLAYKINANKTPKSVYDFDTEIEKIRQAIQRIDEKEKINSIPLKKILINIRKISQQVRDIYHYSQFKAIEVQDDDTIDTKKFIKTDLINWQNFKDNISVESSFFRHALRMGIVLSSTYFILNLFEYSNFGTYWILLTILVILKPGFGLTKERNLQRLGGTVIGGVIGALVLITIEDTSIRFILLVFFFLIAYSLFRINYIMAVIFMTPYVLIMSSFTGMNTFEIAQERILDTFLGGTIAFLSSYIIFPNWESFQIKSNMKNLLVANYQYLAQALKLLSGNPLPITDYKLARKEVYISSANMGSTFQRLLTEPKWRQQVTKEVNRFVILNHIFSSYSATLLTQLKESENINFNNEHLKSLIKTLQNLEKTIHSFEPENAQAITPFIKMDIIQHSSIDSDEAKLITDQLQFLIKISADLQKITTEIISKDLQKIDEASTNGKKI
ncbi:FUSC family protein [Sphingobacterium alkalisoli]|uniref:FUSC family protein n=1 Tax=Sphingobacterium alkalisoli TaxID=1874115 RepID=A0A4U0GWA8_9SPHI|nr:FUSC family membrane protein [Sphingobacterium alkalisoli]TJY63405.1 FUSC family protein [Sphingobacterium alkalisoli]GGH25867.1 membrane protein [Sphingobacterium alkalisoli]